jgi:fibronectin type 3 domain-containing protein
LGSINAGNLLSGLQATAAPTNLKAVYSNQLATLIWTADASATQGYDIYQGTVSGGEAATPVQKNVTGTSAGVDNLASGQTYYFEITAVTAYGVSLFSNEASVTVPPAQVANVAVAATAAGSLTVSWSATSGAKSYEVLEATTSGDLGTTPVKSGITTDSYTATGLTPGQQYFFGVVAVNAGGTSPTVVQVSGTVLPAVPAGLAATAGNASVSLTWSAAAGAATYNVYQGTTAGGEGTTAVQTGISGTSASITGLTNGTAYYFTVAAVDAGGTSAASNEAHATPSAPSSGGGSLGWGALGMLALLRALSSARRFGAGAAGKAVQSL